MTVRIKKLIDLHSHVKTRYIESKRIVRNIKNLGNPKEIKHRGKNYLEIQFASIDSMKK